MMPVRGEACGIKTTAGESKRVIETLAGVRVGPSMHKQADWFCAQWLQHQQALRFQFFKVWVSFLNY
jgi:hypothetical protein